MNKRATNRALTRIAKAENAAQRNAGYTFFIAGSLTDGYRFALVNRQGEELCESPVFASKEICRRALRKVQRHGACTDIRDDTR